MAVLCVTRASGSGALQVRRRGHRIGNGVIAQQVGSRGNGGLSGVLALHGTVVLIAREGKELVALDGSAKYAAVLILVQRVLSGGKEVCSIDDRIADELKRCAVIGVRAGARHHVHQAAAVLSTLCAQHGRLHAELTDRIREREGQVAVAHIVVVHAAIQTPRGGVAAAAGDRDRDRGIGVFAAGEIARRCSRGTARQRNQGGHLTPIQRHLRHCRLINGLFECGVFGLEREAVGGNLHILS